MTVTKIYDPVPYGIDSETEIPAGASAVIIVAPQKRHELRSMTMSQPTAEAFLINGIHAGTVPALATSNAMSSAVFQPDYRGSNVLKRLVMEVGMDLSINVTNISATPARFVAAVVGEGRI